MPLGVVLPDQFEKEIAIINGVNNGRVPFSDGPIPVPEVEIKDIERGRGNKEETPQIVREFIAVEANLGASGKELAALMGVSESSVSAYKNGSHSTASYHDTDEQIKKKVEDAKVNIMGKAQGKLIAAIDKIDLSGVIKPNIASTIAKDMSAIVRNMGPEVGLTVNNNKVVVFRPRTKEEDEYEVLEVQ